MSTGAAPEPLEAHAHIVVDGIVAGRVVPLLGAGVNLAGRPPGVMWDAGRQLPTGPELAMHLAERFKYPEPFRDDLARVSQYVATMTGSGPLYEELRTLFNVPCEPTPVHRFFADIPSRLRERSSPARYQLIVSTNYDDALERAFQEAGEPFDLVSYMAEGEFRGMFLHLPPSGEPHPIERPNEYADLSLDTRSVILKIHGAMDRMDADRDSYVITEDHYIDYLSHTDISNLIPVTLAARLRRSHFLFLGYSLRDWNLRVILHRIWGEQQLSWKSWAIQRDPSTIEQEYWAKRDVEILTVPIEIYVKKLRDHMRRIPRPSSR